MHTADKGLHHIQGHLHTEREGFHTLHLRLDGAFPASGRGLHSMDVAITTTKFVTAGVWTCQIPPSVLGPPQKIRDVPRLDPHLHAACSANGTISEAGVSVGISVEFRSGL